MTTLDPKELREAIGDIFESYSRAEFNADAGTVVSLHPFANQILALFTKAQLQLLSDLASKSEQVEKPWGDGSGRDVISAVPVSVIEDLMKGLQE